MTRETVVQVEPIKESILRVIARIRHTAQSPNATELPIATFSNALNAVGEHFVDLLLQKDRTGKWWLDEDGQWLECNVRSSGKRCHRNFIRGHSDEWGWFPQSASRLADPMTGPDHVVTVTIPSLSLASHVALEQKLRFSTQQDAFATSSTYVKHLVSGLGYPLPGKKDIDFDSYFHGLLEAAKATICKTKKDGRLAYSGSVPHVCLVSIGSSPHRIIVQEKPGGAITECDFVGFLPPSVNRTAFEEDSNPRKLVQRARVQLWMGLDTLLDQCEACEVETAWASAIDGLSASIRNPMWSI